MNRLIAIALAGCVTLWPALAAAQEGAASSGSWVTLGFFAFNFALFVIVLVVYAGPLIRQVFADRASTIQSALDRSAASLHEAEDLANRAARRLAGLEEELKNLAAELERETSFQVRRVADAARSTAERIKNDAQLTGSAIAESGQRRIRERVANTATNVARDLISRDFQNSDQTRLIDSFAGRLGDEARR